MKKVVFLILIFISAFCWSQDYQDGRTINWLNLAKRGEGAMVEGADLTLNKLYEYLRKYSYVLISHKLTYNDEGVGIAWGETSNAAILTIMHYNFFIDLKFNNEMLNRSYRQCPKNSGQKDQFTDFLKEDLFAAIAVELSDYFSLADKYLVDLGFLSMYIRRTKIN
jgi:hypothetical protein